MKSFGVFCFDVRTKEICDKYSNEGLFLNNGDEYIGELNFNGKEDFLLFLNDIGENLESTNYPFPKVPDLSFEYEDDGWEFWGELRG